MSSWRPAHGTNHSCRTSRASSTRRSCSSTPASTTDLRSFATGRCWSSGRPTRARRSRSTWPADHPTILVGRDTGQIPIDLEGFADRILTPVIWFGANHLLTIDNPIGRKVRQMERFHGEPVERARPKRLQAAGVDRRFARAVGARDGLPVLDDGQVVDAANVIWATGFRRDFSWIDLPVLDDDGWPMEDHGVVASAPGLYFVGLPFQRAMASSLVGGVGRDAADIVQHLVARSTRWPPIGRTGSRTGRGSRPRLMHDQQVTRRRRSGGRRRRGRRSNGAGDQVRPHRSMPAQLDHTTRFRLVRVGDQLPCGFAHVDAPGDSL